MEAPPGDPIQWLEEEDRLDQAPPKPPLGIAPDEVGQLVGKNGLLLAGSQLV